HQPAFVSLGFVNVADRLDLLPDEVAHVGNLRPSKPSQEGSGSQKDESQKTKPGFHAGASLRSNSEVAEGFRHIPSNEPCGWPFTAEQLPEPHHRESIEVTIGEQLPLDLVPSFRRRSGRDRLTK